MSDLIVFETGMRGEGGRYFKFAESPNRKEIEDYIEIMKQNKPADKEIIIYEKTYRLVSTTPYIISS